MNAIGTADVDFYIGLLSQMRRVNSNRGEIDKEALDFMLSVIKGGKPEDQLVTMLIAQMAAVHSATMEARRRLAASETILEQDSAQRALNQLARTFASQLETLKRYRTSGPHTVQNVSVADGGQAVVGNVTHTTSEVTRSEVVRLRPSPATANGHANGANATGHANGPTANGYTRGFARRPSLRPRLRANPEH
jgi:hypothetical protein